MSRDPALRLQDIIEACDRLRGIWTVMIGVAFRPILGRKTQ